MSTPTLPIDAPQVDSSSPPGVRLRLKPAHRSCGLVQGAWWPRSLELTAELPGLLRALSTRLGHIDRVMYDEDGWAAAPTGLGFKGGEVTLARSGGQSPHTLSVIGDQFGMLVLLVVPPFVDPARAYTSVMTASDPDDVSTADELLGLDAHETEDRRLALLAQQRWETEGGALDHPGRMS